MWLSQWPGNGKAGLGVVPMAQCAMVASVEGSWPTIRVTQFFKIGNRPRLSRSLSSCNEWRGRPRLDGDEGCGMPAVQQVCRKIHCWQRGKMQCKSEEWPAAGNFHHTGMNVGHSPISKEQLVALALGNWQARKSGKRTIVAGEEDHHKTGKTDGPTTMMARHRTRSSGLQPRGSESEPPVGHCSEVETATMGRSDLDCGGGVASFG